MNNEEEIKELKKEVKFLREDIDRILKAFRRAKKVWKELMKKDRKK